MYALNDIKDLRNRLPKHTWKRYALRSMSRVNKLAIHHSMTKIGSAYSFARYHVSHNDWPGIAYHFVIEKGGDIAWCLNLNVKSYHVGNSNTSAIGICLIGDFRVEQPTRRQLSSMYKLIAAIIEDPSNNINSHNNVLGHSEFPGYSWKECPALYMNDVRRNVRLKVKSAASTKTGSGQQKKYRVRKGDTMWRIAHEHSNIGLKDLLLLNPKVDINDLKVGQIIKLG